MKIGNLKGNFKNKDLFDQALTHRSWPRENAHKRGSNERLEFLGDAILEFVVTEYIFGEFPEREEGYLTILRAKIVNTESLSTLAKKLGVGKELFLSKGESESGGQESKYILANTIEAVIGAIYIDQGIETAKMFIFENLLSDIEEKLKKPLKDAKSILQEIVQAEGKAAPKYRVVTSVGPDHDREFTIEVQVAGKKLGGGKGKSKSEAEQKAASLALKTLGRVKYNTYG